MSLAFIQGHKCVSNFDYFLTWLLDNILAIKYYIQTWHDGGLMDAIYLMHISMILTQGHSGLAKA